MNFISVSLCLCGFFVWSIMVIGLLTLELHFPRARSLRDKRQALRSLETRLRNRFNVAVAEVEHQDLWQRARLAGGSGNTDPRALESTLHHAAGQRPGPHP